MTIKKIPCGAAGLGPDPSKLWGRVAYAHLGLALRSRQLPARLALVSMPSESGRLQA
jgi:hypothetical protein